MGEGRLLRALLHLAANTVHPDLRDGAARIQARIKAAAPEDESGAAGADGLKGADDMTIIQRRAKDVRAGDIITHDPDHDRPVRWRVAAPAVASPCGEQAIIDYTDLGDGGTGIVHYPALTVLRVEPAARRVDGREMLGMLADLARDFRGTHAAVRDATPKQLQRRAELAAHCGHRVLLRDAGGEILACGELLSVTVVSAHLGKIERGSARVALGEVAELVRMPARPDTGITPVTGEDGSRSWHPAPGEAIGAQPGYVVGECGHRVVAEAWQSGARVCTECAGGAA